MGARPSVEAPQRQRTLSESAGARGVGGGLFSGHASYPTMPMAGGPNSASTALQIPGGGSRTGNAHGLLGIIQPRSLPSHLFAYHADLSCPICKASVSVENIEEHMQTCLSKSRICYNSEILTYNKGECTICLDDLVTGDLVARLPCLCVYHKACIDQWFKKKCTCPEHPGSSSSS